MGQLLGKLWGAGSVLRTWVLGRTGEAGGSGWAVGVKTVEARGAGQQTQQNWAHGSLDLGRCTKDIRGAGENSGLVHADC